jgi:hypothetical protein
MSADGSPPIRRESAVANAFERLSAIRFGRKRATAADPVYADAPGWVRRLVLASDLYVIAQPRARPVR